jgi:aspartate aminotransferase
MRELSRKVAGIAASATIEISNRARQMEKTGGSGDQPLHRQPDFDTPQHIKDACIEALNAGNPLCTEQRNPEILMPSL